MQPECRRTTDDGFLKFQQFVLQYLDSSKIVAEAEGRFFQVVNSLCVATQQNYQTLRNAYDVNDQVTMAWTCRNLMEIVVFTKFVLMSEANAKEFSEDRLIDLHEMVTAFKKMETQADPSKSDPEIDRTLNEVESQMKSEGVTRKSYRRMSELAKIAGLSSEYSNMNKVTSKFVHPTAWSLFTNDEESIRFRYASDLFFLFGAQYLFMVFAEVRPHVLKYGLHHKA